jgi:hypothetical protein
MRRRGARCGAAAWRNAKCGVLSAWAYFSAWRAHFSLALAVAWPIVIGATWAGLKLAKLSHLPILDLA